MLPKRVYPFIIAFLSGYPVGAKVVSDLVSSGRLNHEEAEEVLSYSLVTGPAFIIGTIGAFLGSYKAAGVAAAAHYMGAAVNGLLYRNPKNHKRKGYDDRTGTEEMRSRSASSASRQATPLENFTAAISAGFKAMAVILAYLILFMIAIDLLEAAGLFEMINNETVSSVLKGLLEMTAGSNMISLCNINLSLKTALISFIVSFGGLSVVGQSISMTSGSGIRAACILKIKLTHGLLAGIISVILSRAVL